MDLFRSQVLLHLLLHHGEVKSILILGWISESCKFELQWGRFFVSPHLLQIMNQKWIGTYIRKGDELISEFLKAYASEMENQVNNQRLESTSSFIIFKIAISNFPFLSISKLSNFPIRIF